MRSQINPWFYSMYRGLLRYLCTGFALCVLVACGFVDSSPKGEVLDNGRDASKQEFDLLLTGGSVYTVDKTRPWVESIGVIDGRIEFLGEASEAEPYIGEKTRVVELDGRMVMPGLVDAHVHPVLGGMEVATQCLFPVSANPEEVSETLRKCMEEDPDIEWIVGGRWESAFFSKYGIKDPAKWLDQISPDKGISLADDTGHNRWVNSRALELIGFDRSTKVAGGEIVLGDDGEPSGLLLEAAIGPLLTRIEHDLSRPGPAVHLKAARSSLNRASSFGFTGIKEAGDADAGIIAYKALDESGELKMHIVACIAVTLDEMGAADLSKLNRIREMNRGKLLDTNCAKLFLDGVPTEARTAVMVDKYTPPKDGVADRGKLLVSLDWLKPTVAELDGLGYTVKAHVAGDGAVRAFLDAVEFTRSENGDSGLRHELAHSGFIHPEDIRRLTELDVVADMSPSIWYPSPVIQSITAAVGEERASRYFPFRDVLDAGVEVVTGSDWPAVVPDMNPWTGLESMVTRAHPEASYPGTFGADQAISVSEAIEINTLAGARALRLENETGSLELGKSADFIVLNQNLFQITPEQISDTQVDMTWFRGELVYERTMPDVL